MNKYTVICIEKGFPDRICFNGRTPIYVEKPIAKREADLLKSMNPGADYFVARVDVLKIKGVDR